MVEMSLARGFALPPEAVVRTFGILAQRGAGKSNAAVVMAEKMFDAGLHWVAIDPKGDWWGIRASRDGKSPGLPVVIFGGSHADVPLEPTGGSLLADLVVDERLTCVIDVSEFTEGEKIRFLAGNSRRSEEGFAGRLYRRKNSEQDPTHLFLEEAHDYIPQQPFKDQKLLVHVFGKLVTMGRTKGLGATLISQRSARVHKDVLTQIDTLFVLRTTSPQDRKAIAGWLEFHGSAKEVLESLPGLKDGDAWIWSPEWLGVTKRVHFYQRRTYDSGATPVQGRAKRRPATLADVDLAAIKVQMEATIERAKAEDPKELKKQISQLKRENANLQKQPAPPVEVETVEVPVLTRQHADLMEVRIRELSDTATTLQAQVDHVKAIASEVTQALARASKASVTIRPTTARTRYPRGETVAVPVAEKPAQPRHNGDVDLPKCDRTMLAVLSQYPEGCTISKLAIVAGYKVSGGFKNALSRLRVLGFIEGRNTGTMSITADGMSIADADPLPTGQDLIDYWINDAKLPKCDREILTRLVKVYPRRLTIEELGEDTGYQLSGGFKNALSRLRIRGLLKGRNTEHMTVADDLAEHIIT